MSFWVAISLHFIMGGLCAYQGRGRLESREETLGPPYLVAMASTCLVGVPSAVFLFHFYSAWFVHYAFNPVEDPRFDQLGFMFSVVLLIFLSLSTTAGFTSVRYAIRRMHPPWSAAPVVLLSAVTTVFVLVYAGRVFLIGDQDQFLAHTLRPLYTHLAGAVSLCPVAAGLIAIMQCGKWFKVDNQSRPPSMA